MQIKNGKIQVFRIFSSKNLVMSKKSSNFAVHFAVERLDTRLAIRREKE